MLLTRLQISQNIVAHNNKFKYNSACNNKFKYKLITNGTQKTVDSFGFAANSLATFLFVNYSDSLIRYLTTER